MKKLIIFILLIWVSIIFYFSATPGIISHQQSVKFADMLMEIKLIRTAFHELKLKNLDFIVRKNAHAFEYIILAILTSSVFKTFRQKGKECLIYILFTCLFLAVLDEFHQSFIPGRGSYVSDVLIDFVGCLLGVSLFYLSYNLIYRGLLRKKG